jgi:chemotaxis protein histidine kinase CheA
LSEWSDRITKHALWQSLKDLAVALDAARGRTGNSPQVVDALERVTAILGLLNARLSQVDPLTVPPGPFDGINKQATNARAELDAFVSDGDVGHVSNANARADAILANLAALPPQPSTPADAEAVCAAFTNYRARLEEHLRTTDAVASAANSRAQEVETKLQTLVAESESTRQQIAAASTEQQTKFAEAQEARTREFTAAQAQRQDKANTVAAEQQAQFTAAQEARSKESTDAQAERASRFSTLVEEYGKKLAEQNALFTADRESAVKGYQEELKGLREEFAVSGREILEAINKHKSDVEKLVGVIGNLGVTSGYLTAANHARKALYAWQLLTVLSLAALVWVAYSIATTNIDNDAQFYRALAGRVFVSITLGVFAGYAAKQAANFWQVERRNRKLALELEALGPFIASLPPERQNDFREQIGHRSFGVPDGDLSKQSEKAPTNAAELVRDLIKSDDLRQWVVGVTKGGK